VILSEIVAANPRGAAGPAQRPVPKRNVAALIAPSNVTKSIAIAIVVGCE
jgi:hypothetical protein